MNSFTNNNRVPTKRTRKIKVKIETSNIVTVDESSKRMKRLQKAYILDNNGNFDSRFFSSQTIR